MALQLANGTGVPINNKGLPFYTFANFHKEKLNERGRIKMAGLR